MTDETAIRIEAGGLDDPRVVELLSVHVETARAETAPGSAHALDLDGLRTPDIAFFSAWNGDALLGVGALKRMSADHGEIKSMHVVAGQRRTGVGGVVLSHLIATARAQGLTRLSLETGSWDFFKPAHALYQRHGFKDCGPFGDYRPDPNSRFFTLRLNEASPQ